MRSTEPTARPIERVMEGRRAGDPPELVAGNARLLATLDWRPSYADIDTIVGDALNWERNPARARSAPPPASPAAPGPPPAFRDGWRAPRRSSRYSRALLGHRGEIHIVAKRIAGASKLFGRLPQLRPRRRCLARPKPDHAAQARAPCACLRREAARRRRAATSSSRHCSPSSARSSSAPSAAGQPLPVPTDWK